MGVFSYLKDLLGKEPESSKEDVYVVDPEFEESKAAGDTSQSSSGASTGTESKEDAESDSGENHSKSQESASTAPEGLIKDKGTLAHLLEEEKNRPESSAAPRPRVGEEEIAHSFAAEDLAEDSEDGFEVPESGDSRREDSGSWGGQSEGSADARVESGAEGVNGTPHAAVGDEDVVDTDSDEGVVLRIEDDSDGSAEGEVVVPEGSGSPVVESEGVTDGSGVVEDAGSVVKPAGVTEGLGHVEGPVVKSEDKTAGVEDAAEGGVSSSEDVEVEAPVVEPVDETGGVGDVEPSAVESVGEVSSSEDVEVGAPVGEAEDETSEVGGVESAAAVSADEDSSSEHAEDLVVKPVGGTVESERVDDLVIKPVGGTVESERVGDPVVKSGDETDSEPVVVEDSEGTSAAEDGMDLVLESDGPRAETADEEGNGSLSLDGGEQAGGLDNEESVGLGSVADEVEGFESLEEEGTHSPAVDVEETDSPVVEAEDTHSPVVEEAHSPVVEETHSPVVGAEDVHSPVVEETDSPVVEETRSPVVDAEDTHSPVAEGAVDPGAGDAVSGGGVVSDGEETLDVKSEGQTLDLDVDDADDSAVEPSEGVSVADGSYGAMSVVPWSVYMARQSEETTDTEGEDQGDTAAGENLAGVDQSAVEEPAPTVEPENDANSVDEGDEQLIEADEEPVEATVAPGLSLDKENGVEVQDRDDVSFVADSDEDTARKTVGEDSDESVSEPSDLLDEDEGGEFVEAEDSDESEGSSSVVKSELEVDPSLIQGSEETETKKGESDGGLHISIPGF